MCSLVLACELQEEVPSEISARGWLGEPPASEDAISAAELRLGLTLPPSLKAFYRIANGWHWPHPEVRMILPVEQIQRLGDSNNEGVLAYLDGYLSADHGDNFAWRLGIEEAAKYLMPDDPFRNLASMVEISLEEPPMSEAFTA